MVSEGLQNALRAGGAEAIVTLQDMPDEFDVYSSIRVGYAVFPDQEEVHMEYEDTEGGWHHYEFMVDSDRTVRELAQSEGIDSTDVLEKSHETDAGMLGIVRELGGVVYLQPDGPTRVGVRRDYLENHGPFEVE